MRILIAGVAGLLGSHMADRLCRDGHDVFGIDNLSTGRFKNIEHSELIGENDMDVCDIYPGIVNVDWVLNFACPASLPKYTSDGVQTLLVNSKGVTALLMLARYSHAKFLQASTSEVYGDPLQYPQNESYWGNVNPVGVRSVYDEGKRFAEALTMAYHRSYGLSTRIVRIFNTYGPRLDPADGRIIPNFITQALTGKDITVYGDGSQMRSFQYVDDLIEGIVRLMNVEYHMPVNLGNPEEWTVLQLAELIIELTGSKSKIVYLPLPEDDPKRRRPDISLAKRLLDWEPTVSVREGMLKTIKYFEEELRISS